MKKYFVKVNGVPYEVEIEEMGSGRMSSQMASQRSASYSENGTNRENRASKTEELSGNSIKVNSPMPGTVLKINVQNGSRVSKGQVLLILEAMKMENEIIAPADGVVTGMGISKGAQVNAGDILLSIEK